MEYMTEKDRIYARDTEGKVIAEITFPTTDCISTIDHTFVDESLRGRGIADRLVRMAADRILADGHRIAATCPYAVVWFKRHPEYEVVDRATPGICKIR